LANEFEHPEQVVRSAIEDEQSAHFFQLAQLDLPQRAFLLKPAETLLVSHTRIFDAKVNKATQKHTCPSSKYRSAVKSDR
jgi:hypothetical protein